MEEQTHRSLGPSELVTSSYMAVNHSRLTCIRVSFLLVRLTKLDALGMGLSFLLDGLEL